MGSLRADLCAAAVTTGNVIRAYGRTGLQTRIREAIRLAGPFEGWVDEESGWELCAPRPFSAVCFRMIGSDEHNAALLDRINATGEMIFISHTLLPGRYVLRLAIGHERTPENDVARAWAVIRREAALVGNDTLLADSVG